MRKYFFEGESMYWQLMEKIYSFIIDNLLNFRSYVDSDYTENTN